MAKLRRTNPKDKILPAVRANVGLQMAYRRAMDRLIDEMHNSIMYWVRAAFRANEPEMAQDATPAIQLRTAIRKMARRWERNFADAAPRLGEYFATASERRSAAALRKILRDGGWSVEFQMTRAMRDIMAATISEQVNLIKSIPQQYLTGVQTLVMQSVQQGRDLETLSKQLQTKYGVTKRRAALIARDQNNKATASMTRARQQELGINKAVWLHSHAGKKPRPTHVAMDGKTYDVSKGMFDRAVGRYVFPGELINCRCVSRSVVPGFD